MSNHDKRSPREIESEIEHTRSHLDDTIDAIQARFSTGQMVDQALDYLHHARHGGPAEFASNLGETAKRNPVPVMLTGLGLSWLMYSTSRPPRPASAPVGTSAAGDGSGVGEKMGGAATRAKHVAGRSRNKVGHMAHGTQSRIGRMGRGTRSSISSVSHGTGRAGRETADFMREQPLVAGALGIAFGAALGAVLAPTRLEDDVMGEASDDAREAAAETAERQFDKAESAALSASESGQSPSGAGTGADTGSADSERVASSEGSTERYGDTPPDPALPEYRL